ncbi:hypothetical protein HID58_033700 [Brassica napus]|uniref:Auxin response factor n=1 Tax=Brassica napus TaxID=3708 RepID=A0ABQ8C040_BRANA|nr:hypothetical protein HID58_033700 [Brassica napus]
MANNQIMNAQPKFQGTDEINRSLYDQLWKLCAGSMFDLPIIGEQVYYFPQGHIEQANVKTSTDEVYAKVLLLPCSPVKLTPSQEIVAKDLHDHVWKFKHTFKGTPQRHLFSSGTNEFVKGKTLAVGDSLYSLGIRILGENGESQIGIRKAAPQQSHISSSVVSKESMHHGLIATASNAINTKCVFDVLYKPKSSKFIINCDKFIDAVNKKFNIGSRFTMKFEGRDFKEIRYSGTIVKVENFSIYWKNSEWRSLQWDEAATISRPTKRENNEFGDVTSEENYNDQMVQSAKENLTTNASGSFRLFGVDLTASTKARDVLEPLDSYQKGKISINFEEEKLVQIQEVTSLTEIQRKEISFSTSNTKVHMEGVVRTMDLTIFDGYNHMIVELEKLFNIEGKLQMHNQWKLTFKYNEGDTMLVGDDPWPKFCNNVKEIFICSK